MRVPWIRVHGSLIERPVVIRLAESTRITPHEAVGVLVTFWGAVSQHATNGVVSAYSDTQIEQWARWHRKRGVFATWLRRDHLDENGRIREWSEYAGKLEAIRENDRQRKAVLHQNSRGIPTERERNSNGIPEEFHDDSVAARANETRRDETKEQNRGSRARATVPPEVFRVARHWQDRIGAVARATVDRRLGAAIAKHGEEALCAAIDRYAAADLPRGHVLAWFAEDLHRWLAPAAPSGGYFAQERAKLLVDGA